MVVFFLAQKIKNWWEQDTESSDGSLSSHDDEEDSETPTSSVKMTVAQRPSGLPPVPVSPRPSWEEGGPVLSISDDEVYDDDDQLTPRAGATESMAVLRARRDYALSLGIDPSTIRDGASPKEPLVRFIDACLRSPPLPPGWSEHRHTDGETGDEIIYYSDTVTGLRREIESQPCEWSGLYSLPDGTAAYLHTNTGRVVQEHPASIHVYSARMICWLFCVLREPIDASPSGSAQAYIFSIPAPPRELLNRALPPHRRTSGLPVASRNCLGAEPTLLLRRPYRPSPGQFEVRRSASSGSVERGRRCSGVERMVCMKLAPILQCTPMERRVAIDLGSGLAKIGFAGNPTPDCIIPSLVATPVREHRSASGGDYYVGKYAMKLRLFDAGYSVRPVVRDGRVESLSDLVLFVDACCKEYLKALPAMSSPIDRSQFMRSLMVSLSPLSITIVDQSVAALFASAGPNCSPGRLTGTIVDIGENLTKIMCLVDGYLVCSSVKEEAIGGAQISEMIQRHLEAREESAADPKLAKRKLRSEAYGWEYSVCYERFIAPEILFEPAISCGAERDATPLPVLVDDAIQAAPIDYRAKLYSNIVLSGGSTMFTNFDRRLKLELKMLTSARHKTNIASSIGIKSTGQNAVWLGTSLIAQQADFDKPAMMRIKHDEFVKFGVRYEQTLSSMQENMGL
ncbi:Actin- protein 3 [Perkinsus olseni]|uniref:Actin- protein 3 n=1 Tax=Perkinsus olseni TaxID=32597 RepID=A0A7J6P8M9_PEROL|nr:Actin- protein 3 [Perkinsus olseni]